MLYQSSHPSLSLLLIYRLMGDLCLISDNKKKKWKSHPRDKFKSFLFNHLFLLVQVLLLTFPLVSGHPWDGVVVTQADYQALKALKHEFVDLKGVLSTWNDSGLEACSGGWIGIKCARGQVIAIQLPWKGLGGRISEKIGQLQALRRISLHDNLLVGPVPTSLGFLPNLRGVYLFNNRLSGSVPPSIGYCLLLQTLDVSNNLLTGTIPPSLANSTKLYRLNLSFNSFFGSIPVRKNLEGISLSHNQIDGIIPDELGSLSRLQVLDLAIASMAISQKPWTGCKISISVLLTTISPVLFHPSSPKSSIQALL
ncbi:unnamed protein product, partial [Vitis vinifera]